MKEFLVRASWTSALFAIFHVRLTSAQFVGGGGGGGIAQQISSSSASANLRGRPGAFANSDLPDFIQRNQQNTLNAVAASDNTGLRGNSAAITPQQSSASAINNGSPTSPNRAAALSAATGTVPGIGVASNAARTGNIPASGLVLSSITDNAGNVIVGSRLERRPPPVPAGSLAGLSASVPAVTAAPVSGGQPAGPPAAPTQAPLQTTTFAGYLVGSPYPFVLPPPDIPYFGSKWNGPWGYPVGHYQAFRGTGQYITHYQYYPLSYYGSLLAPFAYGVSGKK
ncbi:hypothetical protein RvY_12643-1 [Ramazzottius varieornatus]|uniref:Uncharacterized protein n=1 Tax=Ramazzottius varieornatus TaxID=947166 RepID=A0A1D1VK90_RAMVA|nr:hypothetical protein RvY_12643-1 [Ramazzottius varieornatus]